MGVFSECKFLNSTLNLELGIRIFVNQLWFPIPSDWHPKLTRADFSKRKLLQTYREVLRWLNNQVWGGCNDTEQKGNQGNSREPIWYPACEEGLPNRDTQLLSAPMSHGFPHPAFLGHYLQVQDPGGCIWLVVKTRSCLTNRRGLESDYLFFSDSVEGCRLLQKKNSIVEV